MAIEKERASVNRLSSKVVRVLLASKLISALMSPPCEVHYSHVVKHKIVKLRHPAVLAIVGFLFVFFFSPPQSIVDRNLQSVLHSVWDIYLPFWVSALAQNSIVLWNLMKVFPVRFLSSVFPVRVFFFFFSFPFII